MGAGAGAGGVVCGKTDVIESLILYRCWDSKREK